MGQDIDRIKLTFGFGVYSGCYGSRPWFTDFEAETGTPISKYKSNDQHLKSRFESAGCEPGYIAAWRVSHLLGLRFKRLDGLQVNPDDFGYDADFFGARWAGEKMTPFMRTRVFLDIENNVINQDLVSSREGFTIRIDEALPPDFQYSGFNSSVFLVKYLWGLPFEKVLAGSQITGFEVDSGGKMVAKVGEKPVSEYVSTEEVMRKAIADAIEQYKQLQGDNNG